MRQLYHIFAWHITAQGPLLDFAKTNKKNVETLVLPGEEHIIRKRDSLVKLCECIKDEFDLKGVECS